MFFRILHVLIVFTSFAWVNAQANPPIDSFERMEELCTRGITHEGRAYTVTRCPYIVSESDMPAGFTESSQRFSPSLRKYSYGDFLYKGDDEQGPLNGYLDLVRDAQFKNMMMPGGIFAVEVTPQGAVAAAPAAAAAAAAAAASPNSSLSRHYLVPRNTPAAEAGANAQQMEVAIRRGRTTIRNAKTTVQAALTSATKAFPENSSFTMYPDGPSLIIASYYYSFPEHELTPRQLSFLWKSLGLVADPADNYWLSNFKPNQDPRNSHMVVPFRDYVTAQRGGPITILVGRGQLNTCHEGYNLAASNVLPLGYTPYTIDIDPRMIPHLVADVTNPDHFAGIPDESVDEIFFDGVSYPEIYSRGFGFNLGQSGVYNMLKMKLKKGGIFIVNWTECIEFVRFALRLTDFHENGFIDVPNTFAESRPACTDLDSPQCFKKWKFLQELGGPPKVVPPPPSAALPSPPATMADSNK
jgi:hypothetical protein